MDRINTLVSLNDAKKTIDELIVKLRHNEDDSCDSRKLLIAGLSLIGAIVVVAAVAFAVYKHFSKNAQYEYDDLLDDEDDSETEEELYDDSEE